LTTSAAGARDARFGAGALAVAVTAFFLSGAAGLVYQVAWQRILALMSGVGIYSIALIVAAFMAGLGAGSHLGGAWSLRLSPRRALVTFALVEIGIGAFGFVSCGLYYDVLYLRLPGLYASPWTAGVMHFVTLALPTVLMGTSLPFLVRAMVGEARTAGRTIGVLYGINLLGAAAGAWLAPWVLIRLYGIRGAARWAAIANVAAGVLALLLFFLRARSAAPEREAEAGTSAPEAASGPTQSFGAWMALYALSGFCALSLEILWFRLLDLAVKATAFTFGTMLALYLLGSAVGCLLGAPFVARLRRPLRTFLLCQCLLLVYAGAVVCLLAFLPAESPLLAWYWRYWQTVGGFNLGAVSDPSALWRLYVFLPAVLYGPPTVLMGFAFPVLQRAVQDDPRTSGRKVGLLQAANIAGCMAGSLAIGLLALAWLGTTGTLRLLMVVGALFAVVGLRRFGPRSAFAPLAVALVALAVLLPGQRALWLRLHGTTAPASLVDEDATGVAAILPTGSRPEWRVYVGGKSHSWLPFGGIHSALGATPSIVHPDPKDVAIIGLGSADTAWAAGCRPETRSVTVFEISGPQPRLLRALSEREDLPDLRGFLADPRVRVVVADGRNALVRDERLYDVIEADALWPEVSYAGNLYSAEFFAQCARKLKPGGVICTWAPTPRVYAAFTRSVRHVVGTGEILIGSNQPLEIDAAAWRARLESPAVSGYLGSRTADAWRLLSALRVMNRRGRIQPGRVTNFDLFPRDEFHSPQ
jgi:spermidine synthase